MRRRSLSGAIAAIALLTALPTATVWATDTHSYSKMCEASGAVLLSPSRPGRVAFLVANDQDNVVRAYWLDTGEPVSSVSGADLNEPLGLNPNDEDDKADLEATAWIGERIFWIGSHSRSGKGRIRESRQQFFATMVSVSAPGSITIGPPLKAAPGALIEALAALDPSFAATIRPDVKKDESLAPDNGGFNIEALAGRPDGQTAFIGLRSPLSGSGAAWVVPFMNPVAVVDAGAKPEFGALNPLDLNGRGIRSMDYDPVKGVYYLVAGPAQNKGSFELYTWTGVAETKPVKVPGSAAAIAAVTHFAPEALAIDASGKTLHLFSDDGDRPMAGGKPCKTLGAAEQSFRSMTLNLD